MIKVLFIIDDLGGGGAERVFVNIANGFASQNIEVAFLVGKKRGIYLSKLHPAITVAAVGATTLLKYLLSFPAFFRKNKYTHIFTASHYASTAAIISKKITRVPSKIYLTHHYSLPASRPLKYFKGDTILKLIHFFITPHADKIIAVSKGSLEWLRKFSHHKLKQGSFIYNPVFDESIYALSAEPVNFPIPIKDKIILLSVGRLAEEKDPLTLIEAFVIFKKNNPNAVLFMLGIGPMQAELQNYISKNNLSSSVFLIGFQDNPYNWIASCDVFIVSSLFEGFGNVLVEAMALGKTVVSTNCPSGPAEILNGGEFGYLCPVKNPSQMSDAISKALLSPLNKEVLKNYSQQFTIGKIIKKYIDIL